VYTFKVKQKDRLKFLPVLHLLIALIYIVDLSHVRYDRMKDWIFTAIYLIAFILLLVVVILYKRFLNGISRHFRILFLESVLFLGGAVYFWSKGYSLVALSHAILAGVIILFLIYLRRREYGETIIVSPSNVILPGLLGQRIINWNELTNLIKRDDLLTLDFKDNKLLQVYIIDGDDVSENEFNQFCQEQLREK
jgi:hypothetical protein